MYDWKQAVNSVLLLLLAASSVHTTYYVDTDYAEGSGVDLEANDKRRLIILTMCGDSRREFPQMQHDIKDLIALLPGYEMRERIHAHIRADPEVREAYAFLQGENFNMFLRNYLLGAAEFQELTLFFLDVGFVVEDLIVPMIDLLDLSPPISTYRNVSVSEQTTSGMTGLVEDVLSVIPRDELFLMFLEKLDGSTEFANFVECFGTPEFAKHVEQLQKSVTLGKAAAILRKHHIDFRKIIAMVPSYFLFG